MNEYFKKNPGNKGILCKGVSQVQIFNAEKLGKNEYQYPQWGRHKEYSIHLKTLDEAHTELMPFA